MGAWIPDRGLVLGMLLCSAWAWAWAWEAAVVRSSTVTQVYHCMSASLLAGLRRAGGAASGSGTSVYLFRKKQQSRSRETSLGCTRHAADLQRRADSGEDSRILGGVVTDDWVGAVQASSFLGLCDCVLACLLACFIRHLITYIKYLLDAGKEGTLSLSSCLESQGRAGRQRILRRPSKSTLLYTYTRHEHLCVNSFVSSIFSAVIMSYCRT